MKIKIERQRLYDACRKISRMAAPESKKSLFPETSGILMEADQAGGVIKLTCTDLNVSMLMKLKDVDISESGAVVVPSALFTSMLGAMEGDEVGISVYNDGIMAFQSNNTFVHVQTLKAENFPNIALTFPENTICVSGLSLMAKKTLSVADKTNDDPSYQGVQIKFSSDKTIATATDGVRFLKAQGINAADGELEMLLPERSLSLLCGILKASDELYVGKVNNCAVFMTSEFVFTTKLILGDLDKVERLMDKVVSKYGAVVDAKEFAEALDMCGVLMLNADPCVNVTVTDKCLNISVDNENGNISIDVTAAKVVSMEENKADSTSKVFHYRPKLIYDFVKTCSGQVKAEFTENGVLKLTSDTSEYVISARSPAKIKVKEPVEAEEEPKTAPKTKSKKGKAAKKTAA